MIFALKLVWIKLKTIIYLFIPVASFE